MTGAAQATTPRPGASKTAGGATLGKEASREARLLAAAILEVLAGVRSTQEAAQALGISLPRYYQVESQALKALVTACEAKPRGRQVSAAREVAALRRENERLRREAARQQALVRAAQRAVGLSPPPPVRKAAGKKPRRQRLARALPLAARLRQESSDSQMSTEPGSVPPS